MPVAFLQAQKQLILLKGETVVARYTEGEYFRCKLKNKERKEGKLIDLTNTQIITSNDTLLMASVESIKLRKRKINPTRGFGGLLLVGGLGYLFIGNLNALVLNNQTGADSQDQVVPLAISAMGASMLFLHKPYKKVKRHSLRAIDYTSRFYELRK